MDVHFGYSSPFGYKIGLLIGLGILFIIVGYVNAFLGDVLWGIKARGGFWMTLFHGIVLMVILAIVNFVFLVVPNLFSRKIATLILTFIIGTSLNGIIGRYVASEFGQENPETYQEETQ